MPLKVSKGNMYDWVTHMHSHLAGECPHKCSYCYVQKNRFGVSPRYKGKIRLIESELNINYGIGFGKTIFIEHMNDLFANEVKQSWIQKILDHCCRFPDHTYVFQTKNPQRVFDYESNFPPIHMVGTTIETNRKIPGSKAPYPELRYSGIKNLSLLDCKTFITIEPIMDFDVEILTDWIITAQPDFINIGADSKNTGLLEPSPEKIKKFINNMNIANITIRKKVNLERLLKGG